MVNKDYIKPTTVRMTYKTYDNIPDGKRPVDTYIIITGYENGNSYAYSIDGYGAYYYDSFEAMQKDF